jgi:hypothetical protein
MHPELLETSQQAISLLSEALKGLPVLAVMWYMLRDVRTKVGEIVTKVNELELKVASDDSRVRLAHTEEKLKEFKEETRKAAEESRLRITILEGQMPKIWAKVGDRPEDIKRRTGECA